MAKAGKPLTELLFWHTSAPTVPHGAALTTTESVPWQVEDPPEIESMDDEVLLNAWKDKTLAEINELVGQLFET